jgi:hypothetical protein
MPVTWELHHRVLVIRLIGNYEYDAPVNAVDEAMHDPAFRPGTMLLIDARLSTTRRSSEDLRDRAIWMSSLTARGIATRCALVINSQPHQYGVARMAAAHIETRGMQFEIFTDIDKACEWLEHAGTGAAGPRSGGLPGGVTRAFRAQF